MHGPLIATLLLDLLRRDRPDATLAPLRVPAVSPLFDVAPFDVCGRPTATAAFASGRADADGALAMHGERPTLA